MSTNNTKHVTDEQMHLLNKLQVLLEKQITLARQGNSSDTRLELLNKQAGFLVKKIAQTRVLKRAEFRKQREQLQKLYENLSLTIAAKRAEVREELSRVRKGKKTIETYRSSI